ncbi:MAG: helix-turn-helix domain-containing protein [Thermoleophilaceae bacterium]
MSAAPSGAARAAPLELLDQLEGVSDAVESGAGLPEVARATGRALDASVAIVDSSSSVLAVACASPADERAVLSGASGSERVELRVADVVVGHLLLRTRGEPPPPTLLRMMGALIALEVERARAPERASEEAVGGFVADLLHRRLSDPEEIVRRGEELGTDLSAGATVIVARAHPHQPEEGDWRARVLGAAERGARAVERSSLAAAIDLAPELRLGASGVGGEEADRVVTTQSAGRSGPGEVAVLVPGADPETGRRAAAAVLRELESALHHFSSRVAHSRPAEDPGLIHRAGSEALLAANVAEAQRVPLMAFEETGSYRLLLPFMSEDRAELQRFHEETVAPLVSYDEQYETTLVHTLESFLEADGNVARTAQRLFTHRHTIRYRLERVKELSGLDVGSSDGRERLSLGLKAMCVLGITSPGGPATERGTGAGRVPREGKDRH